MARKLAPMKGFLRTIVVTGLATGFTLPAHAGSYATAYDMSIFLNESHPFDTAAQPVQPVQPAQNTLLVADPAANPGAGEDLFADDEFGDLDGLLAESDEVDVNDPIEPVNRFIFGFNQIVEDLILRPISYTYNAVVPDAGREAVTNFLNNLSSPVVLANDLLQGEGERALQTTQRMLINTTIGVGGLWDAAEYFGIPEHREDFGQTMAVWGVGEGFYLVLPILGPSNPRDAIGRFGVDTFLDPVGLYLVNTDQEEWQYARIGVTGVTEYAAIVEELDSLRDTSIDYYAAIRSFYRQRRQAEIDNLDGDAIGGANTAWDN
ncbi:MAG: VacJ family lipoprotein [Rhodospirillales bacterium]